MKKIDLEVENKLSTIRLKKFLIRREKKRKFRGQNSVINKIESFLKEKDREIIQHKSSDLHNFLVKKKFINILDKPELHIQIPQNFTLEDTYYSNTMRVLSKICLSLMSYEKGDLNIDFSNCIKVDNATLFFWKYWEEIT